MPSYDLAVIIAVAKMSHEEILDATDALVEAGCTDGSLCGHAEGMEMQFTRSTARLRPGNCLISCLSKSNFAFVKTFGRTRIAL